MWKQVSPGLFKLALPDRAIMLPSGKIVFRLRGVIWHDLPAVCAQLTPRSVARMLAQIGGVDDLSIMERFALL